LHLLLLFRRAVAAIVPRRVARLSLRVRPAGVVAVASAPVGTVTLGVRPAAVVFLEVVT
jgi:hypothetical protein